MYCSYAIVILYIKFKMKTVVACIRINSYNTAISLLTVGKIPIIANICQWSSQQNKKALSSPG